MKGRDSKGRFLKKGGSRSRHARSRKGRQRHAVKGYTQHRAGKVVHVHRHVSREAAAPKARRSRGRRSRSRSKRGHGRRTHGARPVIVVANARRRGHHAKAPPMFTMGGMAVFGIGMVLGYEGANLLGRYVVGMDPTASTTDSAGKSTLPSGITTVAQYNELVQAAPPSLKKTGYELGVAALGFVIGIFVKSPLIKLAGYGLGFGALAHIVGQLLDAYIIRPMFVTAATSSTTSPTLSNMGQMLWQHEQTAANAKSTAASTAGSATLGSPPLDRSGTRVRPQVAMRDNPPVMLAAAPAPFAEALGQPFTGGALVLGGGGLPPGLGQRLQPHGPGVPVGNPQGPNPPQNNNPQPPPQQQQPAPPPGQRQPMPPVPQPVQPPSDTGASPPPGTQLGNQPPSPSGQPTPDLHGPGFGPPSRTPCAPCGDPPDEPELRSVPMQPEAISRLRAFTTPFPQRRPTVRAA